MVLHGLYTYSHRFGYLAIGSPRCDQSKDLALTWSKPGRCALKVLLIQVIGMIHGPGSVGDAPANGANRFDQLFTG